MIILRKSSVPSENIISRLSTDIKCKYPAINSEG